MLKAVGDGPPPGGERPFGERVNQLVDDAKAYARAEVDLARAIAADKAKSLQASAILFAVAALLAVGAVSALCVAIFVAFATLIGPLLSGIVTFVLVGALAGLIGWIGVQKLKDAL